eukprot:352544-Chlamydomonas_euryale.AAC.15
MLGTAEPAAPYGKREGQCYAKKTHASTQQQMCGVRVMGVRACVVLCDGCQKAEAFRSHDREYCAFKSPSMCY